MEDFLNGRHGLHAVNRVEMEHRLEPVSAIVRPHPLAANHVWEVRLNLNSATPMSALVSY